MNNIKNILTNKNKFKSSPILTKFEKASALGSRASQIADGAIPLVKVNKLTNPLDIARKELKEGKLPIIIERELPGGYKEYIKISELIDINF